jgi:hypothetical protein
MYRPPFRPTVKSNHVLFIVLAIMFGLFGASCEAVAVGMMAAPGKEGDEDAGVFFAIFSLIIFIVPMVVFLILGVSRKRRFDRFQKLIGLAGASVRLPLAMISQDLGLSPTDTRTFVLEAVANGTLRGRLDVEQGVFVSATAEQGIVQASMQCKSCGGTATMHVVPGQRAQCPYCSAPYT